MSNESCKIFDKLLVDDLYPYDIHNNNILWYNDTLTATNGLSYITVDGNFQSLLSQIVVQPEVWYPIFINENYAEYKYVSNYGEVFRNERLGIDFFLKISNPKFRTFATNGTMATDWILNNHTLPYRPANGILCWARKRPDNLLQPIESFPVGARFTPFGASSGSNCSKIYIKIDNERLRLQDSSEILNISDIGAKLFAPALCYSTVSKLGNKLDHELFPYDLWIADGDCFFYYDSSQGVPKPIFNDPSINTSNYLGYISGSLYNIYTSIYRMLTLDLKREINPKDLKTARKYKNIAKILSTSPFTTQTDIYNLDNADIRNIIQSIDIPDSDPKKKPQDRIPTMSLQNAAKVIVSILQDKSGRGAPQDSWQSDNFIYTRSQLYDKILKKYGSNLIAEGSTYLSMNNDNVYDSTRTKIDNYGISIQQAAEVYTKASRPIAIQSIAYDQKLLIEPKFLDSRSYLSVNYLGKQLSVDNVEGIPLFDKVKPPFSSFNNEHFLSPALVYKGNVSGRYRANGRIFNDETVGFRTDFIYLAELNLINANDLNDNPFGTQADLINIELQALFTNFTNANLYTDTPLFNADDFIASQCQFSWKKISGPEGYFSRPDDTRSSEGIGEDNGILPVRGITNNVLFKTYFTGNYMFECEVKCPIGIFKLKKNIYVVDGRQLISVNNAMVPNPVYGKYWEPDLKQWLSPGASATTDTILLPGASSNADIFLFNNIIIDNKAGVLFPVSTTGYVMEQIGVLNNIPDDKVFNLASHYTFKYKNSDSPILGFTPDGGSFRLNYTCGGGTYVKINKIILSKVRSKLPGCENCVSAYQPNLRSKRKTFVVPGGQLSEAASRVDGVSTERTNKYPSKFVLADYRDVGLLNIKEFKLEARRTIDYPKISTANSPNIKTYGGYSRDVIIKDIGIDTPINGLQLPFTISTNPDNQLKSISGPILPVISGHKLNYSNEKDSSSYKICYQKIKETKPRSITCTKGVLDPNLGWVGFDKPDYASRANRSAVLKFNPGARDTFTFIGPMLREMDKLITTNNRTNTITPIEYTSSIVLGISDHVQWDPVCSCGSEKGAVEKNYQENMLHKEYVDIKYSSTYLSSSNHGYRMLAGGEPKDVERTARNSSSIANDEFDTQQSEGVFSYKFAVTGPYDPIRNIRIPRVNSFSIKDIEIKLNFLNYVNMKDVIILLEVEYDGQENKKRFNRNNKKSPIFLSSNYFINQRLDPQITGGGDIDYLIDAISLPKSVRLPNFFINGVRDTNNRWQAQFKSSAHLSGADDESRYSTQVSLKTYIDGLTKTNSLLNQNRLQLVLWNQEHLQNNKANISFTFSDHAPLNNNAYDQNIYNDISTSYVPASYSMNDYQQKQHIILNNDSLLPSYASMNYSDRQTCFYGNIMKNNRLWIPNNSLTKFISDSLFRNPPPEYGPCAEGGPKQQGSDYNGTTKFTLKFIIMDEPDVMYPYDNTLLGQYQWGFETTEKLAKSTQIFNSLCNWELILHTSDTRKRSPYTTHNLSSYGNGDVLSLLDYNGGLAYPGYSYIADLSLYKHMLPLMNYNAPYNIILDSTTCLTGIDDPSGQGIMLRPPDFPYWAIVAIIASLAAYAGLSGGSLVGAVSALPLAINNSAYQAIYDWFSAVAITSALEDQGRQIFAPLYHKYPFGSPEKVLLNFRKPGGLWHTAEAFISKYHNTPILQNTNYRFTKVNNANNQFTFEIVQSYEELIDKKFIIELSDCDTNTLSSLSRPNYDGYIIDYSASCPDEEHKHKYYVFNNTQRYTLYRNNPNTPTVTENFAAMKYAYQYMIMNSVVHLTNNEPEAPIAEVGQDQYRGPTSDFYIFQNYSDIQLKRIIKLKGRLLYDTLRTNDVLVFPYKDEDGNDQKKNITVDTISLIYLNNSYHTVILLKAGVPEKASTFYIDNSANILLVFKSGTTYYDKKNIKPHNKWGFSDHAYKHDYYTSIGLNIHPRGSYGDGSPFVTKNLLSNNQITNDIKNISESFNNRQNHRIKKDTVYIRNSNGQIINDKYTGGYSGFTYSLNEISNMQDILLIPKKDLKTIIPPTENQTLAKQLSLSIATSDQYNTEVFVMRLEEPLNLNSDSGSLELITDQTEIIPEKDLTSDEAKKITDRYTLLSNTKENKTLAAAVGNTQSTPAILNSNNIHYTKQHADALSATDPNKQLTQSKLNALVTEKGQLLEVINKKITKTLTATIFEEGKKIQVTGEILSEDSNGFLIKTGSETKFVSRNAIATAANGDLLLSFSYKPKISNPNDKILPKYKYEIITNPDKSLTINYIKTNTDHYWINLDPKQSCVVDFDMNPKVLLETQYACIPSSRLAMRNAVLSNNACPEFTTVGNKTPNGSNPSVEEEFSTTTVTDPDNPQGSVTAYVYKIKNTIVRQKMSKAESSFPDILGWKTIRKERYFNINGDEIIGELSDVNGDITIRSIEKYLVPITVQDAPELGARSDNSADNVVAPGVPKCQDIRTHEGSPSGKGLIGLLGGEAKRVGGPTRIQNIVNLDAQSQIEISFKNIPRGLRPSDSLSTVYRYGPKDIYRPSNSAIPKVPYEVDLLNVNGTLNNSLYEWVAMQVDPNTQKLEYTTLPDFFAHQNEMFFRGLYGSTDEIEHKTEVVKSQYPFEMIPQEYTDE